jgi:hypothetical protein
MLDSLITSKTRIKLLTRFFLNSNTHGHLRGLETEFGESSNAIRLELNRFEKAGLLTSEAQGNRKVYAANTHHPLFPEINSLLRKHLGLDQLVEQVIERLGEVEEVYLTGAFAHGQNSSSIEMLLVGGNVNIAYLDKLIEKSAKVIKHTIKYSMMTPVQLHELANSSGKDNLLLLWRRNI